MVHQARGGCKMPRAVACRLDTVYILTYGWCCRMQTGSLTSLNRLRFQNPYGEGDICAAGIIPFSYAAVPEQYVAEGAVWALLQVCGAGPLVCPVRWRSFRRRLSVYGSPYCDPVCSVMITQVEDVRIEGTKKWKPGLALFGGKVQEEDADWLETTAREFAEETGGLVWHAACEARAGTCC